MILRLHFGAGQSTARAAFESSADVEWFKQNNPNFALIELDEQALQSLPDNAIPQHLISRADIDITGAADAPDTTETDRANAADGGGVRVFRQLLQLSCSSTNFYD